MTHAVTALGKAMELEATKRRVSIIRKLMDANGYLTNVQEDAHIIVVQEISMEHFLHLLPEYLVEKVSFLPTVAPTLLTVVVQ